MLRKEILSIQQKIKTQLFFLKLYLINVKLFNQTYQFHKYSHFSHKIANNNMTTVIKIIIVNKNNYINHHHHNLRNN